MPDRYRVAITDRPEIAKVQGTLIKVVKKSNNKLRRVIHSYDEGVFVRAVAGDPPPGNRDRWELVLRFPTSHAANRVQAYIVNVVVFDRKGKVIDGFIRRRTAP